MKNTITLGVFFALAAALPAAAQHTDPGPNPDGLPLPGLAERVIDTVRDRARALSRTVKPLGKVEATITGSRENDPVESGLMIELPGQPRALPVRGTLVGLLREHARNRTVNVIAVLRSRNGLPVEVFVLAVEGVATQDLPIYRAGSDVTRSLPVGTLAEGTATMISGGRVYGFRASGELPAGKVQLARLRFGEPRVRADDETALTGVITGDREDDPVESPLVFTQGKESAPIVGPLTRLIREHARNREVQLQGYWTDAGFHATALRATATERLPLYRQGADITRELPLSNVAEGESVWITGGRVYVTVLTEDGKRGKLQAARLRAGERASGLVDLLDRD